jgi:hypothetical protein
MLPRRKFLSLAAAPLAFPAIVRGQLGGAFANWGRDQGSVVAAAAPVTLKTSLISYWKMDEAANADAVDSYGTNNLPRQGTVGASAGLINNCRGSFYAGGAGSGFKLTNNSTLQMGAGVSFTVTCWTYLTGVGLSEGIYGKWGAGGVNTEYFYLTASIGGGNSVRQWNVQNLSNVTVTAQGVNNLTISGWLFHAFGYDDSTHTAWLIDGTSGGSIRTPRVTQSCTGCLVDTNALWIGNTQWGAILEGYVDEIAFWKRALSDSELNQVFNAGAGLPFSSFT